MPQTAEQLSALLEMARHKEWAALEEAWLESIDDPIADPTFFRDLSALLVKYHEERRLEEMAQMAAMALNDEGRPLEASRALRAVLRAAPRLEALRAPLLKALRGAYGDRPALERYIQASGLESDPDLGGALRMFDQMMWSSEGEVFRHKSWGIGVVVAQDLAARTVTIDFPARRGQTFSFEGLREFLEKIPAGHVVAEAARDPEGLRRRAHEDPVGVVKQVLAVNGRRMKQLDLKALFVPAVFTPSQWSRWWSAAKDRLRLDPFVDVGLGLHGELALRDEPRSPVEDVLGLLRGAETPQQRHQAVREAIRSLRSGALRPGDLAPLSEMLRAGHGAAEGPAEKITWGCLAAELAEAAGGEAPLWVPDLLGHLTGTGEDFEILAALPIADHQARVLEMLHRRDPARFGEICVGLIDEVSLGLAKWMMKRLLEDPALHQAAEDALSQLLHDPRAHPEAYLWALRQVLGGPWAHLSASNSAAHLLARTLDFLEELQRRIDREDPDRQALRGLANRIRNALEEDHHALVVHPMAELPVAEARALWQRIQAMSSLSEGYRTALAVSLSRVRSDLEEHSAAPGEDKPEFHLVTEAMLRAKTAELQHLRTVEIPANSREIQVAREHGDLSENAEYKAAKERQVILHRRAEELQDLLSRARPLDPATVTTECVVPGTRVTVRAVDSGEETVYTILGMWESDPERGVISYLSPLASQFLRRRAGERVEAALPTGEVRVFEIIRIERAI